MKHTLFTILICCLVWISQAQNLVINGDFELYDSCPPSIGLVNGFVQDVYNPQTAGTSDYFNTCSPSINNCLNPASCSVPYNGLGFQYPFSGNGMMGHFVTYAALNYHEYFICKLSQTLIKDSMYEISCQVVLANHSGYVTNNYMVAFIDTTIPITNMSDQTIYLNGFNINHNGFLTDTLNWTKLSHHYKANGTENYLVFGNFLDNILVESLYQGGEVLFCENQLYIEPGSYYYVDAVSVEKSPLFEFFPNVFTPNGDGINDVFGSLIAGYTLTFLRVVNRWGETVFETTDQNSQWDGTMNDKPLNEGVYFYLSTIEDKTTGQTLTKQGHFLVMW